MSTIPSVRGRTFANIVEAVLKLVSEGRLTRDEMARRFAPGDLEIIEGHIDASKWYDIRIHVQLLELLRDVGGPEHLRGTAEWNAQRLFDGGLYQQLAYLGRTSVAKETDPHARFLAFGTDLRLLTSLSGAMFNFGRWEVKVDPAHGDRYLIEISEARPLRDVHLEGVEGFINWMASRVGEADLFRWERPGPDTAVFRMTRPI
jgi:hypothetical protein